MEPATNQSKHMFIAVVIGLVVLAGYYWYTKRSEKQPEPTPPPPVEAPIEPVAAPPQPKMEGPSMLAPFTSTTDTV